MVIIMKKYLFLLSLYLLYFLIIINKKDTQIVSIPIDNNSSVKEVTLKYENGINSNLLINKFNKNDKYLVKTIESENNTYEVKCTEISNCIKDIFDEEESDFALKYNASGFKIKSVTYLNYQ